jgi:hypothetical protein
MENIPCYNVNVTKTFACIDNVVQLAFYAVALRVNEKMVMLGCYEENSRLTCYVPFYLKK